MICERTWETFDPQKLCHQKISVVCITVLEDEHHFDETLLDEHTVFSASQCATRQIQELSRLIRKSQRTALAKAFQLPALP